MRTSPQLRFLINTKKNKKFSNSKDIVILRHDKGHVVVVPNRTSYIEKCSDILTIDQFRLSSPYPSFLAAVLRLPSLTDS